MRNRIVKLLPVMAAFAAVSAYALLATAALAQTVIAEIDSAAKARLQAIYDTRPDLQAAFGKDGVAIPAMKARGLASLEEWARLYGSREHPTELGIFANIPVIPASLTKTIPRALKVRSAKVVPAKATSSTFSPAKVTATSYIVIDEPTRKVLFSNNADKSWPLASISKLMTAKVSLEKGLAMNSTSSITNDDEVGGARLRVSSGTPLTVRQIFDSMLVGSANNAANAVARVTGLSKREFVEAMNAKAKEMGLANTSFVDPTGIEVENVSTATEIAALALEALDEPEVRRSTTIPKFTLIAASETHTIKSTDWLLTDPNNGLYVMGGKTGYLNESGWNFVVKVKDYRQRPLVIVVLNAGNQRQSFNDAATLARWTWANYKWVNAPPSR